MSHKQISYALDTKVDLEAESIRLKQQAELFWPLENEFWHSHFAGGVGNLVDFGCGVGFAAEHLSSLYRSYLGLDRHPDLVEQASTNFPRSQFRLGEDLSSLSGKDVDTILLRFVIQHWPEHRLEDLAKLFSDAKKLKASVVVIDVAPQLHRTEPDAPALIEKFRNLDDYIRSKSGDTAVEKRLRFALNGLEEFSIKQQNIPLEFSASNASEFHDVIQPGLARSTQRLGRQEKFGEFNDFFFRNGGKVYFYLDFTVVDFV